MALKEMPKVGDKVRYLGGDEIEYWFGGMTRGNVYEFKERNGNLGIVDDGGYFRTFTDYDCFELVADESLEGADNMSQYTAEQRQARKGERIVIVDPNEHDSENYERGDVFTVDKVDSAGVVTTTGNIVYHEEYEVLPEEFSEPTPEETATAREMLGEPASDNVEKPAHYTQGKFETIDIIAHIVAGYVDPFVGHCVGTSVKYVSRAPYKHDTPLEDMRKAKRYIEFAIERLEGGR